MKWKGLATAALGGLILGLAIVLAYTRWRTPDVSETPSDGDAPGREALLREMVEIERKRESTAFERAEWHRKLDERLKKADAENEELVRLAREARESRDALVERLNQLSGIPERLAAMDELQEKSRAAMAEAGEIAVQIRLREAELALAKDVGDLDDVVKEVETILAPLRRRHMEIYAEINRNQADLGRLQREAEKIRQQARETDEAVRRLHFRAQEQSLYLQVRRNAVSEVREARRRLQELDEAQRQQLKRYTELEKTLNQKMSNND
jgi:hypothetical protein